MSTCTGGVACDVGQSLRGIFKMSQRPGSNVSPLLLQNHTRHESKRTLFPSFNNLRPAKRLSSELGPGHSFVEEKTIRRFPRRLDFLCKFNKFFILCPRHT